MNKNKIVGMTSVAALLLLGASTASAGKPSNEPPPVSDCGRILDVGDKDMCQNTIETACILTIAPAKFLSKKRAVQDQNGLVGKLYSADDKHDAGKLSDAVSKLYDYIYAVESMRDAAKPKMAYDDANGLVDAAISAIEACQP